MTAAFVAAFSLGEQIKTVGAYAGLAAILGLAVLTMLFVGQAREVKRLREWVGREPELALERERSLAEVSRITPPAASGAQDAQAAPAAAGNGTAAAVESSAAASSVPAAVPAAASTGPAVAAAPAPASAGPAPAKAPGAAKSPARPPAGKGATGGAVGKGQAGGAAASTGPPASPPAPAESKGPAASTGPEPAAAGESAGASGATAPPASGGGLLGTHKTSAITGGGAAFAVAAIVAATQLFGGKDEKRSANRISPGPAGVKPAARSPSATAAPVERSGVTVTVLNGTTTTGLARGAANRLQANGYTIGQVTNAADQSRPSTTVSYGRGFRRLGLDVARLLRVSSREVHPMDAATRVVAGEDAMIVVTVGADQSP